MQAIDLKNELGEYLLDENRKISNAHLHSVCEYKQGARTCRYIGLTVIGYVCAKKTVLKQTLDERVKKGQMSAKGDNCEGLGKVK